MPHKRNPLGCAAVLSAATRAPHLAAAVLSAMVQEHERALGGWQAEWSTIPELCTVVHSALAEMADVLSHLEVHPDRMLKNLDATNGLIFAEPLSFALTRRIGRLQGKEILARAIRCTEETGMHLRDALIADAECRAHVSPTEIEALFDPHNYLGVAEESAKAIAAQARQGRV
jgi:3-carboxy-cis,cis-muconate cycloisomerase